ncbi:GNAT family N-acetyltransferase [Lederbergia wuyishanensis]|uniref:GNAT family acetyltransferase n=1 Tax=Lederbergia wuyishanensis TaxID=1347903 RepID=A0ABU0D0K9_9BACI|nr:GNAT family N-acetyltransferase [Lederbergia wuyishanensis]MCJ8006542.1 GNAT family N-acetyltransferase [Lederbergia wuyishanensis]MDQ0341921.1 putative GNAT family acetyltransferase [Lederbergia wuyishanensis]
MLKFTRYNDYEKFQTDVLPFLEKHEAENNLPIGVLNSLTEESTIYLMATISKGEEIVIVLLQTHPKQIILSKPPKMADDDIAEIAELIKEQVEDIPGLIGQRDFTEKVVKMINNPHFSVHMNQRLYILTSIKKVADHNGELRLVKMQDLSVIKQWLYLFCEEIGEKISQEESEEKAIELIQRARLYAWVNEDKLVTMASVSRPTKNNICISYVFTPIENRKKGFASNCVSALSQLMLDKGYKTTSLYTDLDNPTSNKIYMEIGYEPIMDSILYRK